MNKKIIIIKDENYGESYIFDEKLQLISFERQVENVSKESPFNKLMIHLGVEREDLTLATIFGKDYDDDSLKFDDPYAIVPLIQEQLNKRSLKNQMNEAFSPEKAKVPRKRADKK